MWGAINQLFRNEHEWFLRDLIAAFFEADWKKNANAGECDCPFHTSPTLTSRNLAAFSSFSSEVIQVLRSNTRYCAEPKVTTLD